MPERAPVKRRLAGFTSGVVLVGAWVLTILLAARSRNHGSLLDSLHRGIEDASTRIFSGFPGLQEMAHRLFSTMENWVGFTYVLTLGIATLAVPLAFLVRMVARARLRAGHPDPLDRIRDWTSHRARAAALVASFPVASQALFILAAWHNGWGHWSPLYFLLATVVSGLAQVPVIRGGMRAFLAPTVAGQDGPGTVEIGDDEIRFAAVAVTRETWLAVGSLSALTLAVVGWLAFLPTLALFKDVRVFTVIPAYVAIAVASALLFRGASKISVGVDGIYVGGTSRARFFAYRDLDEARVKGGDIELVRQGRVALRLQLHGEDATRRDAIVARIHEALARVKDVDRDAAANFVTSRSTDKVAQSARGGGDYRLPSVSHEALWSLVEGAAVAAPTRTAAAEALVSTGGVPERERLRVAAAHCADPQVRLALEEMADDEAAEVPYGEAQISTSRSPARM
jgi:hypothetical protein